MTPRIPSVALSSPNRVIPVARDVRWGTTSEKLPRYLTCLRRRLSTFSQTRNSFASCDGLMGAMERRR